MNNNYLLPSQQDNLSKTTSNNNISLEDEAILRKSSLHEA
eukprot:CAMPEP_0176400472 /NCGR_PEP_ID=MMETSP0126-20121128/47626_1 /TAXON_ID=141414 ORGANISM="Strombidinopsis acuminatum, Strain SPMC142" /NCGR_SAMPLE_ID=MMETSP0126 /ASSEMBLY_ACC=CAM_ASM_000229 /LENGTH=39 /DNA_ID= /DNA_START= /DNA_END= /DNA_ORIENTATION=